MGLNKFVLYLIIMSKILSNRLVFDRNVKDSLKSRTRHKRTSGNEVRYQVSDVANIENTTLKQFLSHVDTKQDLTTYLTKYVKDDDRRKKYVVTHDLISESDIDNYADDMKSHDHEETILILQALDVIKMDPFMECVGFSPGTNVSSSCTLFTITATGWLLNFLITGCCL